MAQSTRRGITVSSVIASPLIFMIATISLFLSGRNLVVFARSADVRDLAASLENGSQPDASYLNRFVGQNEDAYRTGSCDDGTTRARLTLDLAALDEALRTKDEAVTNLAQNAIRAAKQRLTCNPLDGNAWLRYAMLDALTNGALASVVDKLRWSYWSTPNESWIIEARLPFATILYSADVPGLEAEYIGDLWRYANYEPEGHVAEIYVGATPQVRALLGPLIAAQPDARKKVVVAEIDRLGVVFSPSNLESPRGLSSSLASPSP